MKIYTRTGDDGTTALIGGRRVSKAELRLDVYGTVDELCATIGWSAVAAEAELVEMLRAIQADLFVLGSRLATPDDLPPAKTAWLPVIDTAMIDRLERQIDAAEAQLQPLQSFILPGGSESGARLHVARTVCRRAERLLVALASSQTVDPKILTYMNRLSDWLFVQARSANRQAGKADIPWIPARPVSAK